MAHHVKQNGVLKDVHVLIAVHSECVVLHRMGEGSAAGGGLKALINWHEVEGCWSVQRNHQSSVLTGDTEGDRVRGT